MKVLDPQSALLTTAEVHQFLKDNPARKEDKKVGAYDVINVANYHSVRRDVEIYTKEVLPQVASYPPVDTFMRDLLRKLQKYDLTKSEVYSLINLGVGVNPPKPTTNGTVESTVETNGEEAEDDEEAAEGDLGTSLFKLIVEESDERFAGEEGEQRIDEILGILRGSVQGGGDKGEVVNGHSNGMDS